MKTLLIILITAFASYGQVMVAGKDINKMDIEYITAKFYLKGLTKFKFSIDCGDKPTTKHYVQEEGVTKAFLSIAAFFNYMYKRGWELDQTFTIVAPQVGAVVIYVLKRKP